jgi:Natural resistance-associated macrophage protein
VLAVIGLVIVVALLPFGGIERVFGYCGLLMLVFVATAIHQGPDWGEVAHGFVPSLSDSKLYLYFVVGVFAAALMPYEVHCYSSGAMEEGWDESNLRENRLNAIVSWAGSTSRSSSPWPSLRSRCAHDQRRRWMREQGEIFVVHRLLDEQILDSDGKRCGRVDDLELRGRPPRATALLVGEALCPAPLL